VKVLSLLQPWATLVVMGIKKIETRSWSTTHRGALLIHASKGKAGSIFTNRSLLKNILQISTSFPIEALKLGSL